MNSSTSENARRALAGELYYAFVPDLTAARARSKHACNRYNTAGEVSRRRQIELWRDITLDQTPLAPPLQDADQDAAQLEDEPWIEPPIRIDYGTNVRLGRNVYINFNCTILDTCLVVIGSRTLLASNVSLYAATHPLDPGLRNGTKGPELGKEIHIGKDCFIGGGVTICPGVRIGRGCTVGAGSVVTRDVPEMCVVAGNPARIIRRLEGEGAERKGEADERVLDSTVAGYGEGGDVGTRPQDGGDFALTMKEQVNATSQEEDRVLQGKAMAYSQGRDSNDRNGSEPLMTQKEWEDETGRQFAEKALLYGASLK